MFLSVTQRSLPNLTAVRMLEHMLQNLVGLGIEDQPTEI